MIHNYIKYAHTIGWMTTSYITVLLIPLYKVHLPKMWIVNTKPYSIEFLIFSLFSHLIYHYLDPILLISIILSIYPSAPVISVSKHLPKVVFWVHSIEKLPSLDNILVCGFFEWVGSRVEGGSPPTCYWDRLTPAGCRWFKGQLVTG